MATIEIPNDIMLPLPRDEHDVELYSSLKDYFTKLRQTLIEIESKL